MDTVDTTADALARIERAIATNLAPLAGAIDAEGIYPAAFLRTLGALGGFADGHALGRSIEVGARVGRVCGSTAFLQWCQSVSAWYLAHAPEAAARERYLGPVSRGELLAGSGLSNALKHLDGIEKIRLAARRQGDGYVVDGTLPWVSNLAPGHLLITAAAVDDGGYVMFAVSTDAPGVALHACPAFSGMEGTATLNVRFKGVAVAAADVLAQPAQFAAFMARVKPGLVLNQAGMGFGVIEGCLDIVREGQASHAEVNGFLADQADDLAAALAALRHTAAALVRQAEAGASPILPVLKLRAAVSELALRAAQAAVLHAGARGYLKRHPAQRRLREAVFVAIVSPALKHLCKAIHDHEQAARRAEAA